MENPEKKKCSDKALEVKIVSQFKPQDKLYFKRKS